MRRVRVIPAVSRCHLLEEDIGLSMCLPRYRIVRVDRFRHLVPVVSPDRVDVAVVVEQPHVFAEIVARRDDAIKVGGLDPDPLVAWVG